MSEVTPIHFLCFFDILLCHHYTHQPALQNVLQAKKQSFIKLPTSAFKVRVNDRCFRRVLQVMRHLSTTRDTNSFQRSRHYSLIYTFSQKCNIKTDAIIRVIRTCLKQKKYSLMMSNLAEASCTDKFSVNAKKVQ